MKTSFLMSRLLLIAFLLGAWTSSNAWAQQNLPGINQPGPRPQEPGPRDPLPPDPQPLRFPGEALFNPQPPFLTSVAVDHPNNTYRDGDKLRIQFVAEKNSLLYLIYHQADGSSLLLFPNEARPDNRVQARTPVVIPPPQDELRFRIRPPLGQEVLQVLATTVPLPELDAMATAKTGKAPVIAPATIAKLAERLRANPTLWTEHRVPIQTIPKMAVTPSRPAVRVGLFIGIGKYLHPEIGATHEELGNSAQVMHKLMLEHGGLDPQRTKLVMNEQATKANLEQLIARWLPSVSQPGDTVFIYFSGHAGQVDCLDGSEEDGKDETLGPYDLDGYHRGDTIEQAKARFRQTNIVDDTLARWLEELTGRQIVLILDTCHSGGVVEGKGLAESFLKDEAQRVKDIAQMNTLVLASCASDEQSLFEGTQNKTMWFTYCLTEAIEAAAKAKQPLTVQQAFAFSRIRMRQLLKVGNAAREQEPQMTDNVLLPVLFIP